MKKHSPDLIEQLADQAGIRLRRRPGVDLIAIDDAPAFLQACANRNVRILGVEGFYLRGDKVHVDMSRIADFSSVTDPRETVAESISFIETVRVPELMLDFTLDDA